MNNRRTNVTLYPSLPKELEIYYEVPDEYIPENAELVGKLIFESSATNEEIYELPLKFKF